MGDASRHMNDYRVIDFDEQDQPRRRLTPTDTLALHWQEREWLLDKLREPLDSDTVVVTHHAPSRESVAAKWSGDWLTPSFVNDLPYPFFEVPLLWVHGHTHISLDYRRGRTRVVSNPRGYRLRDGSFENPQFNPGLIIDTRTNQQPTPPPG
jgi:hypothetical protein